MSAAPELSNSRPAPAASFPFRDSGALVRRILENAAVATFLVAPGGRIVYANDALYALLGYAPDEPFPTAIQDLVAPDDRAAVAREMDAGTQGEAAGAQTELRFLCRNGSSTWVLLSTSLLRDDDAGFHHHRIVQAIGIDAQKKAEAALAESLDRWNFALEGGHQGVWDRDCQADTNFLSPMWRIIRGMEPDEEIDPSQSAWLERLHPDDLPHILQTISNNNSGNTGFSEMRYRERHRDGNYIWILSRGKTIAWLPDGRPARMIGTDTDITRQETLRAALAAETERLDITLNAISDGVISTDCDGRVTMINPAAEKMTGWRSEDADGQRIEYVFNLIAESGGRLLTPVDACLDTRRPCRLDEDAVLVARDGERRGIQAAASPVQTPQGVVLGSVLVFQDVTARRALQRELAYAAKHDCLTGLPNRAAFEGRSATPLRRQSARCASMRSVSSTSTASKRSTTRPAMPPAIRS